jgi:hypothetical protein
MTKGTVPNKDGMDIQVGLERIREARQAAVRAYMQEKQDYFRFLREGRLYEWNVKSRQPYFSKITVPRPGKYPGLGKTSTGSLAAKFMYGRERGRRLREVGLQHGNRNPEVQEVMAQVSGWARKLRPRGLRFVKLVGIGGMGFVMLFAAKEASGKDNCES